MAEISTINYLNMMRNRDRSSPDPSPHLRTTSPPVPRPLWSAPAHSERIGAALSSPKTSTPRGTRVSTPARSTWPGRENHSPHPEFLKIADGNQYNKLLENDEKTEQELSPERIQYSKLLTATTSSLFQVLNRAYYEVRERSVILVHMMQ